MVKNLLQEKFPVDDDSYPIVPAFAFFFCQFIAFVHYVIIKRFEQFPLDHLSYPIVPAMVFLLC